ncbi:ABC transporter ATP-binding protein [Paracraurococcus lichenis]|uniref:ABC transporter ATP-binding protein n=1 Tax=Paracraurococcus lichenis TaxID=3064888 RepID=A0ABT9E9U3_9PROT|nr:ABC transporter ATP-binding protein [Paracraurococcus sp. LOR1-02]MDO9712874.1 ABC transporter ATP-binding protein [Paracraurococcus sp. LOR1-02]
MTHSLLDICDLRIRFGASEAVRGLDLTLGRGETLALVGESGCGKSSVALALLRLLPSTATVTAERLQVLGEALPAAGDPALRQIRGRRIGIIFQEPMTSLNPVLTIGAQIAETLRVHQNLTRRAAWRRAVELLDLVRIPDPGRRATEYPHNLSGGMRQRVMIAIAVACQPLLLIADEPTTALDVTIQAQILELLDSLRREFAMGLLLITHDLGVVAEWADRVIVMYAGRACEAAPAASLLRHPRHPYTIGLVGAAPRLDHGAHFSTGRLAEIPGSIASAAGVAGCAFAPRCPARQERCWQQRPEPVALADAAHLLACPVMEGRNAAAFG